MMPATLSIITNAFPPHERGKAIGTWAGVSALALAIGPVVGGFLVENVSWQSIFFLNVPVAVVAVVVTLVRHARVARRDRRRTTSTSPASPTITVGLAALVLALVEGNSWGWGSPAILGLLAVSAVGADRLRARRAARRRADGRLRASSARARSSGANLVAFIV